jgi:hypothetical protein
VVYVNDGFMAQWQQGGWQGGKTARCPSGLKVLGGGFRHSPPGQGEAFGVYLSMPNADRTGWSVEVRNLSSSIRYVEVFAICG